MTGSKEIVVVSVAPMTRGGGAQHAEESGLSWLIGTYTSQRVWKT
jgi:hypothetical protein